MSKQYADMTYRLSDGRETTYKVELLPESEWPSKEQEIWFQAGVSGERERILTQWQYEMNECKCEDAMGHMERRIKAELIKGEK